MVFTQCPSTVWLSDPSHLRENRSTGTLSSLGRTEDSKKWWANRPGLQARCVGLSSAVVSFTRFIAQFMPVHPENGMIAPALAIRIPCLDIFRFFRLLCKRVVFSAWWRLTVSTIELLTISCGAWFLTQYSLQMFADTWRDLPSILQHQLMNLSLKLRLSLELSGLMSMIRASVKAIVSPFFQTNKEVSSR